MRHIISTFHVVAVSSPLFAQEKQPDWKFKSVKANGAIKAYDRDVTDLNKKAEQAIKKILDSYEKLRKEKRVALGVQLEEALEAAIKIGNSMKPLRFEMRSRHCTPVASLQALRD